MKGKNKVSRLMVFLILLSAWCRTYGQIPQTMNYQGVLTDTEGEPATDGSYDMTFAFYDTETEGDALWLETQTVTASGGLFNVILGSNTPMDLPFDAPYWLGITVGENPEMSPRITLTATPYSLNAEKISGETNIFPADGNVGIGTTTPEDELVVAGIIQAEGFKGSSEVTSFEVPADFEINMEPDDNPSIFSYFDIFKTGQNIFSLSESGYLTIENVIESRNGGFRFPDGTLQTTAVTGGSTTEAWNLTGNSGTSPDTHFLGTSDDQALEFKVNNARAFRIEPDEVAPNIIGGYSANYVSDGVKGATIAGGGSADGNMRNRVTGDYGSIGGGLFNIADTGATVGGGKWNYAYGLMSTIGGGQYNLTENNYTTICGGYDNTANGVMGTVCGGAGNTAGYRGFVGGGEHNEATGFYSTVPGGNENKARAAYSFAAGYKAKTNHNGSFVWSDFASLDSTASTDENQFIIRAAGGVGIGTNAPGEMLSVAGVIESTTGGFKFPDGTTQTTAAGTGYWTLYGDDLYTGTDYYVGFGTTSPTSKVHAVDITEGNDLPAVSGLHNILDYYGYGVEGTGGYTGVKGKVAPTGDNTYFGVWGDVNGDNEGENLGVYGTVTGSNGTNYGVYGSSGNNGATTMNFGLFGVAYGTDATNYAVYANGDIAYIGSLISISDARFKRNITSINGSLSRVMRLRPRNYEHIRTRDNPDMQFSEGRHYGFTAQELEEVFPELVTNAIHPPKPAEKGEPQGEPVEYKAIKMMELIPVLVQAIQEQQATINAMKNEIEELKNRP